MPNLDETLIEYFESTNATFDIKGCNFIYNNIDEGKKVINEITKNLLNCDEFMFSVAFITKGGLDKIKLHLDELNSKGIKGKILTTNYLYFNEPSVLKDLIKIPNIEIRMFDTNTNQVGFHTKGYIFKRNNIYTTIIGSSNLTSDALTTNTERNQSIKGTREFSPIKEIVDAFLELWNKADIVDESYIGKYKATYDKNKERHKINFSDYEFKEEDVVIKPNEMQAAHIRRQNQLIVSGAKRALLISATGSGKTHAAAFGIKDIKGINVKRVLYVTHRENILTKSEKTFKSILGKNIKSAIFSGKRKDISDADYIFATTSMMQKDDSLNKFPKDYFDYIVYDEVHRLGENKAKNIINYFEPKFFLGMSATPDRTDGFNLYELFHFNITNEIRLLDALKENMLCPFNYFGITDLQINNEIEDIENFNKLTSDERVKHVMQYASYYGCAFGKVRGLIFVNSVAVGKELSNKFNEKGRRTVFIDGTSDIDYREKCFERLQADDYDESRLDYILSVDVLNEGIDIPEINQIILLRPTKSAIVFIQQIGRGLRKYPNKKYLNILDFIGNYENNYLIATAFNKQRNTRNNLLKTITENLPGESIIQFDSIARERIYESIDKTNLSLKSYIRNEVEVCQNKLGKSNTTKEPITLCDLFLHSKLDLEVFAGTEFSSFYEFLKNYKLISEAYYLSNNEEEYLRYLSKIIGKAKRNIDAKILLDLIDGKVVSTKNYSNCKSFKFDSLSIKNISKVFSGKFDKRITSPCIAVYNETKSTFELDGAFKKYLKNAAFKFFLLDLLHCVIELNKEQYEGSNDYVAYKFYTRNDFCLLSLLDSNKDASTLNGYGIRNNKDLGLFVTYKKNLDNSSSINYKDEFIDEAYFSWDSRSNNTTKSPEIQKIINWNSCGEDYRILLFIKKENSRYHQKSKKSDGQNHTYISEVEIVNYKDEKLESGHNVVRFTLKLKKPVNQDVFNYLVSSLIEN